MNHQYNTRPPQTPKFNKRLAPATPLVTKSQSSRKAFRTAGFAATTPTTPYHKSSSLLSPQPRTPLLVGTPDRFIPNRARTDVSKARHELFSHNRNNNDARDSDHHDSDQEQSKYHRQLRQALWGKSDKDKSIMVFGAGDRSPSRHSRADNDAESPFRHDVFRPVMDLESFNKPYTTTATSSGTLRRCPKPKHTIRLRVSLEAPDILEEEDLTLVSCGPSLAVAIDDSVYLWKDDSHEILTQQGGYFVSCISWSNDGKLLAVGLEVSVQIWCPENKTLIREMFHGGDFTTALAWKGDELLAANAEGILRYNNIRESRPIPIRYESHGGHRVASLLWNDDFLASAGGGTIKLWDPNQRGEGSSLDKIPAKRVLKHPGVRRIRFCPSRSHVLVSGGDGGIRFWNTRTGAQLSSIRTSVRITEFHWSPFRSSSELVVAHGDTISLWELHGSEAIQLAEKKTNSTIISMDCSSEDGMVICAHEKESVTGYSVFRGSQRSKGHQHLDGSSLLALAVIR